MAMDDMQSPAFQPDVWVDAYTEAAYSKPVALEDGDHSGCMRALKLITAAGLIAVLLR